MYLVILGFLFDFKYVDTQNYISSNNFTEVRKFVLYLLSARHTNGDNEEFRSIISMYMAIACENFGPYIYYSSLHH